MKDKITINTQSSIRIEWDKIIYFDPYKISEQTNDADYIFITHNHYDHYDIASIKNIMKATTKIIIPDKMAPEVLGTLPSKNIIGVIPKETYQIDDIKIETVPSYNINKEYHPLANNWVGYIIVLNNERIYIAGDTDLTKDILDVKTDIALIPIGGKFTMNYKEAAELINTIKPKAVIPTHYGSIVGDKEDYNKFSILLNNEIECLEILKN